MKKVKIDDMLKKDVMMYRAMGYTFKEIAQILYEGCQISYLERDEISSWEN